jgi:hypothetical protein
MRLKLDVHPRMQVVLAVDDDLVSGHQPAVNDDQLPGLRAERDSSRLHCHVSAHEPDEGAPIIVLHGASCDGGGCVQFCFENMGIDELARSQSPLRVVKYCLQPYSVGGAIDLVVHQGEPANGESKPLLAVEHLYWNRTPGFPELTRTL